MSTKFDYLHNTRWRKLRAWHLMQHPLCVLCAQLGRTTAGNTVDHIKPHSGPDDPLLWDPTNLQTLCRPCHSRHKQSADRRGVMRGCDANGEPLDRANHHWFKKP